MADSSLDEFFAKKDKSRRGKAKAKFTTSDTIAKKLEEGGKKGEPTTIKKEVKEKIPLASNVPVGPVNIPTVTEQQVGFFIEDDEWKNIEEEKERDYSGLRIQALSISEKEKEEEQLKEQMLSDQNGESSKMSDGQSGPWKKVNAPVTPALPIVSPDQEEIKTPEPVVKEEVKSGVYKAPALRNVQASTPGTGTRRNPKSAPQISSELHFPSLSSAADGKVKYSESDRSFQSVKHGIRSKAESQPGLQLDLENKFSALHQGE